MDGVQGMLTFKTKMILATAVCFAIALFSSVMPAHALVVPVGRSALVNVKSDMGEVIVADPAIADVYVHGKNKISIIGKGLGRTTVRAFDENNDLVKEIDVTVGYDLPAIRKTLKEFMPYETIGVEMVNTNIALTGEVSNAAAVDKASKIVDEYVSPSVGPNSTDKSDNYKPKILNLLQVSTGQQVMLRVRVGEIRRSAIKNLGVNLQAVKNAGDTVFRIGTGGGIGAFTQGSGLGFGQYNIQDDSRGFFNVAHDGGDNDISAMLEALESNGIFKLLAEPNLISLSGEQSQFLAGGEIPIPVANGLDNISIEYKPFGVSVKFTPYVLTENRIRIQVAPEVSDLDAANGIVVENLKIPAISTRRAQTVVELAPGESFMIAGLINDKMTNGIDQIPGVSEIPILSALFRSSAYKREETELVLAVTPYLVDPLASSDVKLPTDNFRPASTMESFFYGALGSMSGNASKIGQTPQVEGPIGFMVD
ncbi:MAG: type II and III secretion system protein family protein [Rickettsiales bacterium]